MTEIFLKRTRASYSIVVFLALFGASCVAYTNGVVPEGRMEYSQLEEQFILESGDGDPEFMHVIHTVRPVERDWFNGQARGQPAELFEVVGPDHVGKYVALSTRVLASIDEQMDARGMASVVVNLIDNPSSTYGVRPSSDVRAVGMTVLRRPGDHRF